MRLPAVAAALALVVVGAANAQAPGDKSRQEFLRDADRLCEHEWTRRGELDLPMFHYCMANHERAYQQIEEFNAERQDTAYTDMAYPYCYQKWTRRGLTDTEMMAHCLDLEVEGMADIVYYIEQVGRDTVMPVAEEAMARYGSWHMAGVMVSREFDAAP